MPRASHSPFGSAKCRATPTGPNSGSTPGCSVWCWRLRRSCAPWPVCCRRFTPRGKIRRWCCSRNETPMDHDQRFKTLIKIFFADFLRLFFAAWAARLNCDAVEWFDTEIFPDPPGGSRRLLDLVAKLPTLQPVPDHADESWLALVHIEIEAQDRAKPVRERMFRSYGHLRGKHGLPVLPIVLFLRVGLDGVGIDVYEEHFWEFRPVLFQYLYVGLPSLDAVEYVQGDNWLGVALSALMRISPDRVASLGAEALRRLKEAPLTDQQRFLLAECVEA